MQQSTFEIVSPSRPAQHFLRKILCLLENIFRLLYPGLLELFQIWVFHSQTKHAGGLSTYYSVSQMIIVRECSMLHEN